MQLENQDISTSQKIAYGAGFVLASRFASKIMGFLSVLILARYLGVDDFGLYSLVLTFVGFFLFLNDFGVSAIFIRKISSGIKNESEVLGEAAVLKFFLSVLAIAVTLIAAVIFAYSPHLIFLIGIFSITHLFGSLSTIYTGSLQAKLKMFEVAIIELSFSAFYLASAILVWILSLDISMLLVLYVISTLLSFLIAWHYGKKYSKVTLRFSTSSWIGQLKESWPFALTMLFTALYNRIDILMLSKLATVADIGKYSAAFRLTESLYIIPAALTMVLYPIMSKYSNESKEVLTNIHRFAIRYTAYLFIPAAFGATVLASRIMFWIYGAEFLGQDVYIALALLSWSALFLVINLISTNLLYSVFMENRSMCVVLLGIFFNATTNLIFIPVYGFVGAAFTTLLTELLLFIIFNYMVFKKIYRPDLSVFIRSMVAGSIMAAALTQLAFINIVPLILIGAAIYFLVLYLIRGFSKEDFEISRKIAANLNSMAQRK